MNIAKILSAYTTLNIVEDKQYFYTGIPVFLLSNILTENLNIKNDYIFSVLFQIYADCWLYDNYLIILTNSLNLIISILTVEILNEIKK